MHRPGLLKKPKILILDDSTSAVDTRTDALIRQGFRKFIPETTKIIIAQRVASVQDADRIILPEQRRHRGPGLPQGADGDQRHLPGDLHLAEPREQRRKGG